MKHLVASLILSVLLGCLGSAQGQVVDQLIDPISMEFLPNGTLRIEFEDLLKRNTPEEQPTRFVLQQSDNVSIWAEIPGSDIPEEPSSKPNGRHLYRAEADNYDQGDGIRKFYRILGYSSTPGIDSDGDGLSDALEATIGSNASLPDSDGDGFSDAREYLFADPRDASITIDQENLPAVEFAESISPAMEGDGTFMIPLEISSSVSNLTVNYTVNARSTASSPGDFQALSGSVTVSGTTGAILITLIDDDMISAERLIILDLDPDPVAGGYRVGGRATHVVCLSENDSYWNGVLSEGRVESLGQKSVGVSERNFRLCVVRQASGTSAVFVAGSKDGLSAPSGVGGSQSDGVIPVTPSEEWPAVAHDATIPGDPDPVPDPDQLKDTATHFKVVSSLLLAGTAGLIEGSAGLQRKLTLEATDATMINSQTIKGTFTDLIASYKDGQLDPAKTYLNRTRTGSFTLVKALPEPADVESEFRP